MAEYYDDVLPEKKRRVRKPTWTDRETRSLVSEFDKRKEILRPKVDGSVRTDQRQRAWVEICRGVNVANPLVHRTVPEVQKKWQNLCLTMKREFDMKETTETPDADSNNQNVKRDELENFVIQGIMSSDRGLEDPGTDFVCKIENVESLNEDDSVDHADDGEMFNDEINDRVNPSDQEVAQSYGTVDSRDSDIGNNMSTARKRQYNGENVEQDKFDLMHLKKQKMRLEMKKCNSEIEKLHYEKEKLIVEKEKMVIERDKLALELDILRKTSHNTRLSKNQSPHFEKPSGLENARISGNMQSEQFMDHSVKEKSLLERERIQLENEKLKLELQILRNSQSGGKR